MVDELGMREKDDEYLLDWGEKENERLKQAETCPATGSGTRGKLLRWSRMVDACSHK